MIRYEGEVMNHNDAWPVYIETDSQRGSEQRHETAQPGIAPLTAQTDQRFPCDRGSMFQRIAKNQNYVYKSESRESFLQILEWPTLRPRFNLPCCFYRVRRMKAHSTSGIHFRCFRCYTFVQWPCSGDHFTNVQLVGVVDGSLGRTLMEHKSHRNWQISC